MEEKLKSTKTLLSEFFKEELDSIERKKKEGLEFTYVEKVLNEFDTASEYTELNDSLLQLADSYAGGYIDKGKLCERGHSGIDYFRAIQCAGIAYSDNGYARAKRPLQRYFAFALVSATKEESERLLALARKMGLDKPKFVLEALESTYKSGYASNPLIQQLLGKLDSKRSKTPSTSVSSPLGTLVTVKEALVTRSLAELTGASLVHVTRTPESTGIIATSTSTSKSTISGKEDELITLSKKSTISGEEDELITRSKFGNR